MSFAHFSLMQLERELDVREAHLKAALARQDAAAALRWKNHAAEVRAELQRRALASAARREASQRLRATAPLGGPMRPS